jgi:hypothetical protein
MVAIAAVAMRASVVSNVARIGRAPVGAFGPSEAAGGT